MKLSTFLCRIAVLALVIIALAAAGPNGVARACEDPGANPQPLPEETTSGETRALAKILGVLRELLPASILEPILPDDQAQSEAQCGVYIDPNG